MSCHTASPLQSQNKILTLFFLCAILDDILCKRFHYYSGLQMIKLNYEPKL